MIPRKLFEILKNRVSGNKAIVLLGPRQTGKTTLIKEILSDPDRYLFLDGDDPLVQEELSDVNTEKLKQIIGSYKTVFIDEAQRISNVGMTLKLITDQLPGVSLFVSGSSAFEINQKINEPLTGRKWEYHLFPISWTEFQGHVGFIVARQQLEQRLIFGMYPEVIMSQGQEKDVLMQLTSSYLYKDVLSLAGIRKPEVIVRLLKALAFQVGNEVSYNELANLVQVDKNTIGNYIDILEKAFVIFRLQPFSRNLRNEISTTRKIYFYDNGVRNSLISNYAPLDLRQDKGALWENFMVSERIKSNHYNHHYVNSYFWRTRQKQEIDYIEDIDGQLTAFEFKYSENKKVRFPVTFGKTYQDAKFQIIHAGNFDEFLI